MSRRKGEVTGHMNEREFSHLVELKLPPGGFRSQNLEFEAFHREYGIPIRRGRGRHEVEQFHVRFCFPDAPDRKSTRLNSSHVSISYAVFCLKKKKHMRACAHSGLPAPDQ